MTGSALVVEVKRNSLDDGPGIRSVVFFKGCPLRCVWCQNPEALRPAPELQVLAGRCVGCGGCVAACPGRVAVSGEPAARCTACGRCVEPCRAGARRLVGTAYDIDDLAALLLRDEPFYRASGGGVTLSGGEPTMASAVAGLLAARLVERGVHVLLETCGCFAWEPFARDLLPHVSTIYFDLKIADTARHHEHTGRDNELILRNLRRLAGPEIAPRLLPRVPLVPGITDGEESLAAIAGLLLELRLPRVALLPYNPLWLPKRRALGLDLPYSHDGWMTTEQVERCRDVFRRAGLEVK
jgi:pyruvate formate lyase activating enzyme